MNIIILSATFGLIGGLARAFFGLLKHYRIDKKTRFRFNYLIISLLGSAVIGIFTSLLITTDYKISLVAGYVGIDIIENLIKAYKKKLSL